MSSVIFIEQYFGPHMLRRLAGTVQLAAARSACFASSGSSTGTNIDFA
jgi:hypothetical protein